MMARTQLSDSTYLIVSHLSFFAYSQNSPKYIVLNVFFHVEDSSFNKNKI